MLSKFFLFRNRCVKPSRVHLKHKHMNWSWIFKAHTKFIIIWVRQNFRFINNNSTCLCLVILSFSFLQNSLPCRLQPCLDKIMFYKVKLNFVLRYFHCIITKFPEYRTIHNKTKIKTIWQERLLWNWTWLEKWIYYILWRWSKGNKRWEQDWNKAAIVYWFVVKDRVRWAEQMKQSNYYHRSYANLMQILNVLQC